MDRANRIEALLRDKLEARQIEVEDDSARHAGHAGARDGGGHFNVTIVSARFEGMNRVERHRAVYEAIEEMIPREIHALSVRAFTPAEAAG